MPADPKIENIKIEKIQFNFNNEPFNKTEIKNKILSLLPNIDHENVSFYIRDANTAIANGLRRVIEGELKIKILTCDIKDIDTDEDFVKRGELIDRINYIPIDQNLPMNAEFSLNISNTDPKKEYLIVHSSDMVQTSGNSNKPFAGTFRIAELRPGKYLIIPKIKVIEGYGFNYSAHCLTTQIEYHITDYIPVKFVNERANIISKRVKTTELLELFKRYKIKYDGSPDDLFRKKILIIPNKSYQHLLTSDQKKKIKQFDIVVENPDAWEINELNFDDKFLKEYQSTEMSAKNFFLSFMTNGNIDPKKMMQLACENINERLINIKESILEKMKEKEREKEREREREKEREKTEGLVTILQDNIKTIIIIRGEDYTIGQLIKLTMFELDPRIGLINNPLEHPLNRTIMLNIKHPEPIKITIDAIDECVKNFEKIKKYFN